MLHYPFILVFLISHFNNKHLASNFFKFRFIFYQELQELEN